MKRSWIGRQRRTRVRSLLEQFASKLPLCSSSAFLPWVPRGALCAHRRPFSLAQAWFLLLINKTKKLETNERLCSFSIGAPVLFHELYAKTKVTALQLCRGEVWYGSHWAEIKVSTGLQSFLQSWLLGHLHFLAGSPFLHPQSQQCGVGSFYSSLWFCSWEKFSIFKAHIISLGSCA